MLENMYGLTLAEIEQKITALKLQKFRAKQIADWMYKKGASSFAEMTNIGKAMQETLSEHFVIQRPTLIEKWDSSDGETTKFLLGFGDGVAVESVLMRHNYGSSICISTQAGCAMGCAFCASTVHGVERNLTSGEMLAEVLFIDDYLRQNEDKKVDTMVLMGSGEPMMNYENVVKFMRLVHEPYTLGISYRSITLSTAGIVEGIDRLAAEEIPVSLAISLHAPNDDIRSELMPINKKYGIAAVVAAGKRYGDTTKRRVTYEYLLIAGVNDSDDNAKELARLIRGQLASVNLIPLNPVTERDFKRPSSARIEKFLQILTERHIAATVRREMGTDIAAACGQLRNQHIEK